MRSGENALQVIDRVKAKLNRFSPRLPPGVKIVSTYDRSELILRSIDTLKHTLFEEIAIVSLVILIFLWHIPSALIPILTIPITVLIAFIPMKAIGVTSNIMSLGGIAIAIGAMVDAAIVVVEQTHKKLEIWEAEGRKRDYHEWSSKPSRKWRRQASSRCWSSRFRLCPSLPWKRRKEGCSSRSPSPRTSPWPSLPCWQSRLILPCGCCFTHAT